MIFRRVFRRLFGGNEWTGAKGKTDFRMTVALDGTISLMAGYKPALPAAVTVNGPKSCSGTASSAARAGC